MKTSSQIRQEFLDFFKEKGHRIVPSAPVIPYDDDETLFFTNAGMNQFKDVFLGTGKRDYKRCADTQKCIRVSGKHNDLEEVGHDGYHHTFFEMLGNWSFGDYYKKEAIQWAWELLTKVWKLDKKKLWATVYKDDEESFKLWKTVTDIDPNHILKFGEKDNFWEMGETGPCGPCSEIHYDFTPNGCKPEDVNSSNPDVMEIWNLVFIQYNRDKDGKLSELPQKHVDTGMGFERIVRVLQNKKSNYATDVFLPLINELIELTGKEYSGKYEASMNVIADHVRTLTFAIGDGAIPSNEGRGYVLRRVLRRAARYGRNLDMHKPFIYKLVDVLVETMGNIFPEIVEKKKFIKEVIQGEEESFNETLDRGIVLFNEEIERMKKNNEKEFSGEIAFKLHDTFGFPIDLTELMAREIGYAVDMEIFNDRMEYARGLSREDTILDLVEEKQYEELTSYHSQELIYNPYNLKDIVDTQILKTENRFIDTTGILLSLNPFYKKSGGQVSDSGSLIINDKKFTIRNVCSNHIIEIDELENLDEPVKVVAEIDIPRRLSIQRNHSATHLVHEALRRVLGSHIEQMGSYIDDSLLRFDFPHFHKLTVEEIKKIEDIVNEKIIEKIDVETKEMRIDDARKLYPNLRSFFEDKYEDIVRVVIIDKGFSVELCGGTHVKNTSEIGFFKIVKEESVGSGIRRITGVTWNGVILEIEKEINNDKKIIDSIKVKMQSLINIKPLIIKQFSPKIIQFEDDLSSHKNKLVKISFGDSAALSTALTLTADTTSAINIVEVNFNEEKKQTDKQLAKQKVSQASESIDELVKNTNPDPETSSGTELKIVSAKFEVDNADELKEIADKLREKIGSGVGLLYAVIDNKVSLVAVVSDNLIKEKSLSAGKIVGDIAKLLGGGGGGKPHLAAAGGKDVSKLDEAILKFPEIVKKYLSK